MEVGYRTALLARAPPDASESPRPDRAPSRPDGACSPTPRLLAGVQAGLSQLAAGLYESPGLAREAGTPLALAAMPEAMIAWHCREAGVAYIPPGTPPYEQEGTGRPKATKHRRARIALLHKRLAAASLAAGAASGRPATPLETPQQAPRWLRPAPAALPAAGGSACSTAAADAPPAAKAANQAPELEAAAALAAMAAEQPVRDNPFGSASRAAAAWAELQRLRATATPPLPQATATPHCSSSWPSPCPRGPSWL